MKTYLEFSLHGDITEIKTKETEILLENYTEYTKKILIEYNKYNFCILINERSTSLNLSKLPFYDKPIKGKFLLFCLDDKKIKSLTENKFMKFITISQKKIEDYSSDDFNLSDD